MADWSKPTITSNYVTFVDEVKARDVDAITLQWAAVVNPPNAAVKLLRLGSNIVRFQEWNGSVFADLVLSVAGGGTGSSSLAGLGSAMGLGTMAYQNANTVAISGGTIGNISFNGNNTFTGGNFQFQSTNTIPVSIYGNGLTYMLYMTGNAVFPSHGMVVKAGTGAWDEVVFAIQNAAGTIGAFTIRGNMAAYFTGAGLVIPVGTNKWVA